MSRDEAHEREMKTMASAPNGIHHVYIETHDWGKSLAFWQARRWMS